MTLHDVLAEFASILNTRPGTGAQMFRETGTLWENYAPEYAGRGHPAKPDFVGWTGVSAITIPIEYVVGLRLDA